MKTEFKLPQWLRILGYAYSVSVFLLAVVVAIQYHIGALDIKKQSGRHSPSAVATTQESAAPLKKTETKVTLGEKREPASTVH